MDACPWWRWDVRWLHGTVVDGNNHVYEVDLFCEYNLFPHAFSTPLVHFPSRIMQGCHWAPCWWCYRDSCYCSIWTHALCPLQPNNCNYNMCPWIILCHTPLLPSSVHTFICKISLWPPLPAIQGIYILPIFHCLWPLPQHPNRG